MGIRTAIPSPSVTGADPERDPARAEHSSIPSATSSGAAAGASAGRHLKEILQLQRAGISTAAAETLLQRMLAKIDTLRTQRNKLKAEQRARTKGKFLGGRR